MTVDESASGERLDRALAAALPSLTRSRVKALIESRRVALADGRTIEEPSRKVKTGERFIVDIPEPEPAEPKPQAIDLDILYEDSDLLVLNKPAGLVVHPAPGNPDSTLVNALLAHCGDSLSGIGGVRRPGIVHRLDKDTSGRHGGGQERRRAISALAKLFAAHDLDRIYQALVWGGCRRPRSGTDRGRHRPPPASTASAWRSRTSSGRTAVTDYWVERRFGPPLAPIASLLGPSSRPAGPTRSASIWPISAARWSATRSMAAKPRNAGRPPHALRGLRAAGPARRRPRSSVIRVPGRRCASPQNCLKISGCWWLS